VDIDVLEDVNAGPLILEERYDSVSVRGLNGQRDTGRLAIVERAQGAVDNQPLAQLRRKALLRDRTAAPSGAVVAIQTGNDQESRLVGRTRELPDGASEQILEAPDEVVRVDARAVVRLACDELTRGASTLGRPRT
jgi:hypothetical protein